MPYMEDDARDLWYNTLLLLARVALFVAMGRLPDKQTMAELNRPENAGLRQAIRTLARTILDEQP